MGSRNSDDPMDLGPFLQNYVMKNPFDQLHLVGNKEEESPEVASKPADNSGPKSSARSKLMPILPKPVAEPSEVTTNNSSVEKDSSPKPEECGEKEPGSEGEAPGLEDQERDGSVSPHSYIGGHLGSNVAYAINLRQNKVSDVHEEAQLWLWRGYRYIPSYKGLYSVNELLSETQGHFPHISSVVLSHIMKFTFPDCLKLTNKSGVYYQGLITKPSDSLYTDENLLAAASAVQKGLHTVESAASTHCVPETSVASLAFWEEEVEGAKPNLMSAEYFPEEELPAPCKSSRRKSQRGRPSKKHSGDEEWRPPVRVENGSPRRCPRLRASPRDKINSILMAESADSQEESDLDVRDSNKREENLTSSPPQGSSRARKRKSKPLKTVSVMKSFRGNNSVSDTDRQNPSEYLVLRNLVKTSKEPNVKKRYVGDNSPSLDTRVGDSPTGIHIKEEPKDCGYGERQASPSRVERNGKKLKDSSTMLNDDPTQGCARDCSPPAGALTGHNADLPNSESVGKVNQLTLRMVLEKIHDQGLQNKTLEEQLMASQQEVQTLHGQLHSRDEQLAELASAFFSLNNQFQAIAHRFKMVLSTSVLDRNMEDINDNDSPDDR